jgi:flavin-dependent dehydrogenase
VKRLVKTGTLLAKTGDSLSFVDPFTGSGILSALLTGRLAGIAAARRIPRPEYVKAGRSLLGRAFLVSSVLRRLVGHTEIHWLAHYFLAKRYSD